MSRATLTDRMEKMFQNRPNAWIHFSELARVGGIGGWRARVSDCRKRGLKIENRQETVDGYKHSWYRYKRGGLNLNPREEGSE